MAAPKGNDNRRKGTEWADALKRAMARSADGDFRVTLTKLADVVVAKALEGDPTALREIAERMDGKPAQSIVGDGGGPVEAVFRWATEND